MTMQPETPISWKKLLPAVTSTTSLSTSVQMDSNHPRAGASNARHARRPRQSCLATRSYRLRLLRKQKNKKALKVARRGEKQSLIEQLVTSAQKSSASTSSVASNVDPVTLDQAHKNTSKLDFLTNQCEMTLRPHAVSNHSPCRQRTV